MQGSQGWRSRAALLLVSSILSSCTIMRGAPKPPLPAELLKPDSSDQTLTLTTADLAALEAAQSTEERNRIAVKAMLAIDLRYAQFRHMIWAEQRQTGAITSLLTLGASVAGTLTDSLGVKNNYLALSTLLTGTSQTIDSKYLYDRTSAALVTTMDAERLAVAARLMKGMNEPIESYRGYAALRDLVDYYNAGTLTDAVAKLQDQASSAKVKNQSALAEIHPMTEAQIKVRSDQTMRIMKITFTDKSKPKLLAVLKALGVTDVDAGMSVQELRKRLIREYQDRGVNGHDQDAIIEALSENGFL